MTRDHAQAFAILECFHRRGIWVELYRGKLDITPPPGKRWKRGIKELLHSAKRFEWEIKVWLRWQRRQRWKDFEKLERTIAALETKHKGIT